MDLKGIDDISLIDFSSEDDLLISDPPPRASLEVDGLPGNEGMQKENLDQCCENKEQAPAQVVFCNPKRGASGKVNLRKSLAWDNAFFTSEGVLNAEELAIVSQNFVIPAIQEDLRSSFDSTTTFDDENLTVESIEIELFGNIRASIQKSYDKCDNIPTIEQCSNTTGSGKMELQGSKKTGIPSHVGRKPPMVLKRDGIHSLRQNETSKELSSSHDIARGKGNTTKQQRMVPNVATGLPKKTSIPQLIQVNKNTRRDSDSKHLGRTFEISAPDKPPTLIRKTAHGSSGSNIPSSGHLAASRSNIPTSGRLAASSSLCSRPGRMSDQARKAPSNPPRKNVDSNNATKISSNLGLKSPLFFERKNVPANAKTPKSFLKFSAASPSSSLESIESSCSTASTVTNSINSSSSFSSENAAYQDMINESSRASLGGLYRNHTSGANSLKVSRTSGQSAGVNRGSEAKQSKPSGLRMPRPKMGYFDAEKSATGVLSTSQVESKSSIPKVTSRIGGSSGKPNPELSDAVVESIKAGSQLETVLQSTSTSHVASGMGLGKSPTTAISSVSHNQKFTVNTREKESEIQEVFDSNKTLEPVCQVGYKNSSAVGDDPCSNLDSKCIQQFCPTGVSAKVGDLEMDEIDNLGKASFKIE